MIRSAVVPREDDVELTPTSPTTALGSFGNAPMVPLVSVPAETAEPRAVGIVIADQPIFRHGLRRLLETNPRLRIVGEAGDSAQTVTAVLRLRPDVLLLGAPPGRCPLDTLEKIAALHTPVRTILLTTSVDTADVLHALQLGACGVILKDAAEASLFQSIDCVMAGQYWVGIERAADVVASVRQLEIARRRARAFGLTRRELELVHAIVDGETNKAIGQRFCISENTVKRHLTHIFNKVGASNRLELAMFAAHHQLVDLV